MGIFLFTFCCLLLSVKGNITMDDVKKYGAAGTLSYVITVHKGIFQDGVFDLPGKFAIRAMAKLAPK